MNTLASALQLTLQAAGLPVVLVEIGKANDRKTWIVTLENDGSAEQRAQAETIIAAFDPASIVVPRIVDFDKVLEHLTDDEARRLSEAERAVPAIWRFLKRATSLGMVDVNTAASKEAIAALVAGGLLSDERVNELLALASTT